MDPNKQQQGQPEDTDRRVRGSGESAGVEVRLPVEGSPYVKYDNLEDYKRMGYGTEGHQEPKPGRGAGTTDAPTLSGAAVSSDADVRAAEDERRRLPK